MRLSWDDLQTVEALVRTGAVLAAAKDLGLRHSSVSRRVAAIEQELGAQLFLRGRKLTPTSLARRIAEHVVAMGSQARAVEVLLDQERRARDGKLVITTNDVLAPLVLEALAAGKIEQHTELVVADAESELEPGVTDIAVRPSGQPGSALRGARVGRLRIGVYRSKRARETAGAWVLPSSRLRTRTSLSWLRAVPADATGPVACNTILAMRDACVVGLGRAVLPACLAIDDERLVREGTVSGGTPVWVLTAATGRSDPRLKHVTRIIVASLKRVTDIWET
jgi:DNA-binding transcriptional LysR family regulator